MVTAQELYDLIRRSPVSCPGDAWVERVNGELAIVGDDAVWPDSVSVTTYGRLRALMPEFFDDATLSALGWS